MPSGDEAAGDFAGSTVFVAAPSEAFFDSAFAAVEKGETGDACPNCGTSYSAFQDVGRLGCSQCYEFFQKQLLPLLRSIHGNTRHVGKIPQRYGQQVSRRRKVRKLQEELELAIQLEQFERAAELRDEIRKLAEPEKGEEKPCRRCHRTLTFVEAPMLHWPDCMFTYIPEDKLLLPNDAFGQHVASCQRFEDEVGDEVMKYAAK